MRGLLALVGTLGLVIALAGTAAATTVSSLAPRPAVGPVRAVVADTAPNACGVLAQPAVARTGTPSRVGRWRAPQLERASAIIQAGQARQVPVRGQAIAVMAAMGATELGALARPVFGARGRAGADPVDHAAEFYGALLRTPHWRTLPPTLVAHQVLGNADPNAFAGWWDDAGRVVRALTGSTLLTGFESTFGGSRDSCTAFRTDGRTVAYPVPAGSGFRDAGSFGTRTAQWRRGSPGTDIRVACGTPVLASTAGTVRVRGDAGWAGRWLVRVAQGPGRLATSYAHLRSLSVADGSRVQPGDQIGEVGDLGNVARCTLGFQVRPAGVSGSPVDPTTWLADHVGDGAQPLRPPVQPFVVATFNVLGDSHTHEHKGFRRGAARMPRAFALLEHWQVAVAGLQELQPVQLHVLERIAGSAYGHYPTNERDTENALIWRTDTFELVAAHTISIPYFGGHQRNIPVVELRQRSSGATAWFINTHNPADIEISRHNAKWRAIAVARERAEAIRLLALDQGPVFLTGDMNDRQKAMNGVAGVLHSAGGSATRQVDYIFGSFGVRFSDYYVDGASLRGISDHRLVVARADIG